MSNDSMSFAEAIAAFANGGLDSHEMSKIVDAQLAGGEQVESLQDLIDTAHKDGQLDNAEHTQLLDFVADSMTVFGGDIGDHEETEVVLESTVSESPEPEELAIGSRLRSRFIIDEVLGFGGMGTVYKGRDSHKIEAGDRNPYLAIKVLNENFAKRPDAFVALQREASRQQRLAHPNIATVFDFDRSGKTVFITMELLEGQTLDKFLRAEVRPKKGLPLAEVMPIIEAFCAALKHAHDRGIVHADFKPGNCFISDTREVKVLDFGIARAMKDPNAPPQDQTLFDPRAIGALTPAYASPEMIEDSAPPDPRDDIYALACVTYELLSGQHPFKRVPATEARDHDMKPPRLKKLNRRQNDALARALDFDRDKRTPNVTDFLEALRPPDTRSTVRLATAVALLAGIAILGFFAFNYLEKVQYERLLETLRSEDPAVVMEGIAEIDSESPAEKQRLLQAARLSLLDFFRRQYEAMIGAGIDRVDFAAVEALLERGASLYQDSAQLANLRQEFTQLRADYLIELANRFERNLEPGRLLPKDNAEDLHDVYARLREVDPESALLRDIRIPAAYASAVKTQLEEGELQAAGQLVSSGLELAPEDRNLLELGSRVDARIAERERQQRLEDLRQQLATRAEAVRSPADLAELVAVAGQLEALQPEGEEIAAAGQLAIDTLSGQISALLESPQLGALTAFLDAHQGQLLALKQNGLVEDLRQRQAALVARRDELNERALSLLTGNVSVADRRQGLGAALRELTAIDPDFPQQSGLSEAIVQSQLSRADAALARTEWDRAREELALASSLDLGTAAEGQISEKAADIKAQEQAHANRLEAERREERARRQRELITGAEARVKELLTGDVPDSSKVAALRQSLAELRRLDADNPLLEAAFGTATGQLVTAAREFGDAEKFEQAFDSLDLAATIAPSKQQIDRERQAIETQRQRYLSEQRAARVTRQREDFDDILSGSPNLENAADQASVKQALQQLAALEPGAAVLDGASRSIADTARKRGDQLLAADRFDAAQSAYEFAAVYASGDPALNASRQRLQQQREAYEESLAQAERDARVEAAKQRFAQQVEATRLSDAARTLVDIERLAPDDGKFSLGAHRLLATEFADFAEASIARGRFPQAAEAIDKGISHDSANPRFAALQNRLEAARLEARIDDWVKNPREPELQQARTWLDQFVSLAPERFDTEQREWVETATARVNALRGDRARHNSTLALYQRLWPGESALARIEPIPAPPPRKARTTTPPVATVPKKRVDTRPKPTAPAPLDRDTLMGKWCSDGVAIEFENSRFRFILDAGQEISYPVDNYTTLDNTLLVVNWRNQNRSMQTEFGNFSDDRNIMVQIRGRASGGSWQRYDRNFRRCP